MIRFARYLPAATTALALSAGYAGGQTPRRELDQATFVILRGTTVVGREELVLRSGRSSGTDDGFLLSTTATYPADQPTRSLSVVVEFSSDSQPSSARFEEANGERLMVFANIGPRRVTARIATPDGESFREFASSPRRLIAEDSLFGPYAVLPGLAPGPVRAISLKTRRQRILQLTDHGLEPTVVHGDRRRLRHISLAGGGAARHLWYDQRGRLIKVSLPGAGLTAVRTPASLRD